MTYPFIHVSGFNWFNVAKLTVDTFYVKRLMENLIEGLIYYREKN